MVVVDPLHSVIAEARIREQTEVQSRLIFALYDGAVKAIKAWEANPALLKDTAGNAAGGDSEADVPPPVQRYAWSDFGRSKVGWKNISDFVQALPGLYQARELSIIGDDASCVRSLQHETD